MKQVDLLLLLWDALQQRQTTFGQVLDLSAACGLDGRRVLADHFTALQQWPKRFSNLRSGWVNDQQLPINGEQPCSISPPSKRFRDGFTGATVVVLLEQKSPVDAVNPNKQLSNPTPRKPTLHINGGAIVQFFIMTAMVKLVVCPLPKLGASLSHCLQISGDGPQKRRGLQMKYRSAGLLSKPFRWLGWRNVSGVTLR